MKAGILVLNLAVLLFISYRIWSLENSFLRKFFWPALVLKLAGGICLGLVYSYYYSTGDTFNYFHDGVKLASLARTDAASYFGFLWAGDESFPISSELIYKQPRALFLSKITSLFCLLTADNYWMISLYFSAISFFGSWFLVQKINRLFEGVQPAAILSFLFFPSVIFWSAGVIKECLAIAALFFLSLIFLKVWKREKLRWTEWLLIVTSLWIVWSLKYYYLAIFLPVAFTTLSLQYLLSRFTVTSLMTKVLLWFLIFTIPILLVSLLHPNFYYERFMEVVVSSYYEFQAISNPDDLIHYDALSATPLSLLKNSPWALFSGLFRPFITEASTTFQSFIAFENLVILTLTAGAITQVKKLVSSQYRVLLFAMLMYSILLCIFLALSTPNFGTLSRYRVGFLPYLVFVLTVENPLVNKMMTLKIFRNLVR
jgi:hypothetical protein